MSKSPKALLPSSLSLASLSRALPGSNAAAAAAQSHHAVRSSPSVAAGSAKRAGATAAEGCSRSDAIISRHHQQQQQAPRRPASPLTAAASQQQSTSVRRAGHGASAAAGAANRVSPRSAAYGGGGILLRRARSVASSAPSTSSAHAHYYTYFTAAVADPSSSAYAPVTGPSGSPRYFHSARCAQHQQAIAPSPSSSIIGGSSGSGIVPPPGPGSSSGAAVGEGSYQPKHPSSTLPLSSHDGPLLPGPVAPGSGSGSSLPTALDATSSSSTPAASSQTQQQHSTSTAIPATLFSHAPPASVPSHALPAFFGSALNIARRSNLVFRNGAYGIPKSDYVRARSSVKGKEKAVALPEANEAEHYLSVGVGEDSYFLRPDSLGVADGVGGWSGHAGANSARWARKFMHHCSAELARYENVDDDMFLHYYEVDPVEVMQRAYEKTLSECKEEGTIGSSTALLAVLRNDELRLANLGDCSCCVIRGDEYIFRTEEQQHRFNYPFQAGTNAKDTPAKDAQKFAIKVRKDDIVILSSDGLVDNVFSDDMLEEVLRFVGSATPTSASSASSSSPPSASVAGHGAAAAPPRFTLRRFSPQAVSEALCHRAKSVYEDQRAVASPFQQRAMEEGIHYAGGKIDDISCLVGVVGELEASPNRRDVT
ncbi:hypothetical protein JCM10908_004075 [Rhodotorula pacifica]|uniref:PP2C family serine/threonine-protein phosphatase n=1 Tax=Rhodotorula pacifica TaxID=1495444 RepID=UPI00317891F1